MISSNNYFSIQENYVLGDLLLDTSLEEIDLNMRLDHLRIADQANIEHPDTNSEDQERASLERMAIYSKMQTLYSRKSVDDLRLDFQSIPWDRNCVARVHQGKKPYSENFFKGEFNSEETLSTKMDQVAKNLLKGMSDTDSSVISWEINEVSSFVENIFRSKGANNVAIEVEFFASFIVLDRTRSLGPLAIRNGAKLSEKLIENASRIYVLSECLLGGVFFGVRSKVGGTGSSLSLNLNTLKILSKGAISTHPYSDSIEASYNSWKEQLLNSMNAGFPIACKFKNLGEILK